MKKNRGILFITLLILMVISYTVLNYFRFIPSKVYYNEDLGYKGIKSDLDAYTTIDIANPNIDFRRVRNLKIFFDRKAISLTTDTHLKEEWRGGDIVIFKGHVAIISDKRNSRGIPYIIHQSRRPKKEEDALLMYEIIGHYRFHLSIEF